MYKIEISKSKVCRKMLNILFSIEILLAALDYFLHHKKLLPFVYTRRAFNITREDTISNWFNSTQTFLIGVVLLVIYFLSEYNKKAFLFFAVFFMYLGIDDAASIHERLGSDFSKFCEYYCNFAKSYPSYYWHIIVAPPIIMVGAYLFYFIFFVLKNFNLSCWVFCSLAMLAFAIGLDFLEGLEFFKDQDMHLLKLLEELLEMVAMSLFFVAFVRYLLDIFDKYEINFTS